MITGDRCCWNTYNNTDDIIAQFQSIITGDLGVAGIPHLMRHARHQAVAPLIDLALPTFRRGRHSGERAGALPPGADLSTHREAEVGPRARSCYQTVEVPCMGIGDDASVGIVALSATLLVLISVEMRLQAMPLQWGLGFGSRLGS